VLISGQYTCPYHIYTCRGDTQRTCNTLDVRKSSLDQDSGENLEFRNLEFHLEFQDSGENLKLL
jgi:hypothetical protein